MSSDSSDSESSLGMNNSTPSSDDNMRSAHEEPPDFKQTKNYEYISDNIGHSNLPLLPNYATGPGYAPHPNRDNQRAPYLSFQNPPQSIPPQYRPLPIPTAVDQNPPQSALLNTQLIPEPLAKNILPLPPPPLLHPSPSTNQKSLPPPILQRLPSNALPDIDQNLPPPLTHLSSNSLPINNNPALPSLQIRSISPPGNRNNISVSSINRPPKNLIKGPGSLDFDAPPLESPINNLNALELKKKVAVIDIEGFLDHQIIDFEYKPGCCSKVSRLPLKSKILQLKENVNLNAQSVSLLRQRLSSVNINITGPYNVVDLSILIHCLKIQRFEIKALRMMDKVDELYRVVTKSSNYLIQNLDQIWEESRKWKEMENNFKPIVCLTSGLVLKGIENYRGVDIQEGQFEDQLKLFLTDPDAFWTEIEISRISDRV